MGILKKKIGWLLTVSLAVVALTGCAPRSIGNVPISKLDAFAWPDKDLKHTFETYWMYRSAGDVKDVLKLEAPYVSVMVDPVSYSSFIAAGGKGKKWDDVKINSVDWINQGLIIVGFTVNKEDATGQKENVYYKDRWLLMDGRWYHAFDDPIINPDPSMNPEENSNG